MSRRIQNERESQKQQKGRKRVLFVDDHPLVCEGLSALIRATCDLSVSGEAHSAEEAFQQLAEELPDLVMIDLTLPGTNGLDLIKQVRDRYPGLRVLVLSMHEEGVYAERALRAGAHGYIMKQMPGTQIIEAIRTVLSGEVYVSSAIAARLLRLIVEGDCRPNRRAGFEDLSNRELQVFLSIGNGLSTQEIADQLHLSVKTIQTYREHIKRKFGLRNATDLVHYATQRSQADG